MRKSVRLAALLVLAALAGCASSPKSSFYTLSSATPAQPAAAPYRVAIAMVTVPDIVDRPQIVTRSGSNQVSIDEFSRWAEPLKTGIPLVIAANLAHELSGVFVSTYPQSAAVDADCRVQLEVQRFDSTLNEAAVIEILWTVRPAKGDPKSGRSTARETTGAAGYDALVSAHSRALASISRDVAQALRAARCGN